MTIVLRTLIRMCCVHQSECAFLGLTRKVFQFWVRPMRTLRVILYIVAVVTAINNWYFPQKRRILLGVVKVGVSTR